MTGAGSSGVCAWSSARIANAYYWTLQLDPADNSFALGTVLFHPPILPDVLVAHFRAPVARIATTSCKSTDFIPVPPAGSFDPSSFVRLTATP
jgi:hypothetical protein